MSVFLSRISFISVRGAAKRTFSCFKSADVSSCNNAFFRNKLGLLSNPEMLNVRGYSSDTIQPLVPVDNASLVMKKKTIHKKPALEEVKMEDGHFLTLAYATAHSYDLKSLKEALLEQKLYEPGSIKAQEIGDVLVVNAVYTVGTEPREIIFFQEGAVVFWNCTELEATSVLDFIKRYEIESYPRHVIDREREIMTYVYQTNTKKCHLQESTFVMVPNRDNSLERYTFSHAMAQSARLGAWEARLETLAAAVRAHTGAMERDGATRVDKREIVRKLGELFSLRHRLTVESDLLDTPDCYWEDERLERLYSNTLAYFTISRRTRVLSERLSHCVEMFELLSAWASDRHHVRLEWMIIALIMIEVVIELRHAIERSASSLKLFAGDLALTSAFSNETEENMFCDLAIVDT